MTIPTTEILLPMRTHAPLRTLLRSLKIVVLSFGTVSFASAQSLQITNFAIYGGQRNAVGVTAPAAPGYGVVFNSSTSMQGGNIGSEVLIQTTGNSGFGANLLSGGTVSLNNSNTVSGRITAANGGNLTGNVLSVGSSANLSGAIDVNGNILIGGGTVSGTVTQPSGATYSGPAPAGGRIVGTPNLPVLPAFPAEITFPAFGATTISNNTTLTPGNYGAMTLNGNKTVTFNGPGVYVFRSIKNTGNANTFNFNFQNASSGQFQIYVHGDVDLGKIVANLQNGGSAGRLYLETHGTGSTSSNGTYSFMIANGSNGSSSKWLGTVYATRASICMGSGTGSTNFTGCLWSRGQVLVNSGVNSIYSPLVNCSSPTVNAGPDKTITCSSPTVALSGSSTTTGVTYSWAASLGGVIVSGAASATPTVSAAGRYILTVSDPSGSCTSTDTAFVTANTAAPSVSAGADKALNCTTSQVTLNGSSGTAGVSYSWAASNGGNILSGATTASAVVNASGTYVLTVTNPVNGCFARDTALVTSNTASPGANAGPDKVLTCAMGTVTLNGTTLSGNSYVWTYSAGGNIVNGANTLIPIVDAPGTYTLTVTNTVNGCTSSDQAVVTTDFAVPNAEAGDDNALTCVIQEVTLNGSSTLQSATFLWGTSGTGNIVSGGNTATPVVNGLGKYYLTVTDPGNGCFAIDSVEIVEGPCILPYYTPCPGGKYYGNLGCELGSLYDNYIAAGTDTIGQIFTVA
ncbi:MAG: hypothetical protein RL213_2209, partial [Bacteroidota bacterium]